MDLTIICALAAPICETFASEAAGDAAAVTTRGEKHKQKAKRRDLSRYRQHSTCTTAD